MIRATSLVLGFFFLIHESGVFAQPGELDPTFSEDGSVLLNPSYDLDQSFAIATQPNGDIIIAGSSYSGLADYGFLYRFDSNGALDITFGSDGLASTLGSITGMARFYGIAIDAGGRILAVGNTSDHSIIMRYLSDGTLDPEFGLNGLVQMDLGTYEKVTDVALDGNGRIVLSVDVWDGIDPFIGAVRLLADGALDATFSFDGWTLLALGGDARTKRIALDGNGRILIGGSLYYSSFDDTGRSLLVRYNEDGSLDQGFAAEGVLLVSMAPLDGDEGVTDVSVLGDGRILASGRSGSDGFLLQIMPAGGFDPAFSFDGRLLVPGPGYGTRMVTQPDGRILVVRDDLVLYRYNADGTLDQSFGSAGTVAHQSGFDVTYVMDAEIQHDGKLVLCSNVSVGLLSFDRQILLTRIITGLDVGIPEFTNDKSVLIFPNPITDRAEFTFELTQQERLTAEIYDAQGKTVRTLFAGRSSPPGQYREMIDLTGLGIGSYTIVLSNGTGYTTVAIIKAP